MPRRLSPTALACALVLAAGCSKSPEPAVAPALQAAASAAVTAVVTPAVGAAVSAGASVAGIAWRKPHGEADVEAAFAEARERGAPVFLYWGAVWCPPCNQVKATVFSRTDFIDKSRRFVPVYLDGDLPAAQKLGARFKVGGYPTTVLLRPDGSELTRLPGGVGAQQYLDLLDLGLGQTRPMRALLLQARKAPATLAAADWRRLAWYDWAADEQALLPRERQAAALQRLADTCPPAQTDAATRLLLKALLAREGAARPPKPDAALRTRLLALLADEATTRANLDLVSGQAGALTQALTTPGSREREELQAAWAAVLDRVAADAQLSHGDRLDAVIGRIELARLDAPKDAPLSAVLQEHVRAAVARADREVQDDVERQSVINSAAYALRESGQGPAAEALLTAELKRSHSPYYFMLALADHAKRRGDAAAALQWAERAYRESKGPATRVQWGSSYVAYLIELAPQDAPRIESAAAAVLGELDGQPDAFYDRTRTRLEKMSGKLLGWADAPPRQAVLERLRTRRDALCRALPAADPQRAPCAALLDPAAARRRTATQA